jgi:integrase-like protein
VGSGWQDSGLVFTAEDGGPLWPHHVSNHFQDLIEHPGLPPIRLHDLRHGAATIALAGVDMKVVQEMLGHAVYSFTADGARSRGERCSTGAARPTETAGHTSGTPEINSGSASADGPEEHPGQLGSVECPRSGSCRKHTDSRFAQPRQVAGSGSTRLSGKPLVIEARVPLVMERRRPVRQS